MTPLSTPSRRIPFSMYLRILLGNISTQIGFLVSGIGLMVFLLVGGFGAMIAPLYFSLGSIETTQGFVSNVSQLNMSVNDRPVYAYDYSYRVERLETNLRGTAYTTGARFRVEETVTVEYLANWPSRSRIQNTRTYASPSWLSVFMMIFPLAGLITLAIGLRAGLKNNRLLHRGILTVGELVDKASTGSTVNDQPVYKLTFNFTADDGQTYQAFARNHVTHPLEDQAREQILYNPYQPKDAVLIDNMPGQPSINEFGDIYFEKKANVVWVLILPALALLGSVIVLSLRSMF